MAAVLNMVGAFAGQKVAQTVGKGIVTLPADSQTVVLAALVGAITWNLITWYFGLPSSSSHALIGGLIGATLVAVGTGGVNWTGVWEKVIVPMIGSPIIGFAVALVIMNVRLIVHRWAPRR
jgi:PiT family inorganic phosphate transporter